MAADRPEHGDQPDAPASGVVAHCGRHAASGDQPAGDGAFDRERGRPRLDATCVPAPAWSMLVVIVAISAPAVAVAARTDADVVQSTHRVVPNTVAVIAICRNALALSRTLCTNAGASLASAARSCSLITASSAPRACSIRAHQPRRCRWLAERSQSRIQGLKDRTRVTRAGEERADLGQQPGIGMQRIEVGKRERWERRQLSGRAGADLIGVGDESRVGGGTDDNRDAQDRPGSRRDRRGDQRLAVADVAHQSRAVSAAIRAAFTGERPVVHGFALARGAGDLESPVGGATQAGAALERVAAGQDSGPGAGERKPPDGTPGAVAQHTARDLPMADVVRIRPGRPLSRERRIEQDSPGTRGARRRC